MNIIVESQKKSNIKTQCNNIYNSDKVENYPYVKGLSLDISL